MPAALAWRVGAATAAAVATAFAAPQSTAQPANIAGMIVFLDPGHSGATDASRNRPVPDGRGGTTPCESAGAATGNGYPEHTLTWEVALRVRAMLNQLGVRSALSRGNDDTPGPCVDARAATANATHPNAIVSIDADAGPSTGRGFRVNYSQPALNAAQAGPAVQFARLMRDQLQNSGIPPANYVGTEGLSARADLAGLNTARYPAILVQLGNMENPADAAVMTTPDGRAKYATAVAAGVEAFLAQSTQSAQSAQSAPTTPSTPNPPSPNTA